MNVSSVILIWMLGCEVSSVSASMLMSGILWIICLTFSLIMFCGRTILVRYRLFTVYSLHIYSLLVSSLKVTTHHASFVDHFCIILLIILRQGICFNAFDTQDPLNLILVCVRMYIQRIVGYHMAYDDLQSFLKKIPQQ